MEKRWVVRRSEPVKEVLLIEERVYPGGVQGTIGLQVQKRLNFGKYRCTRTWRNNAARSSVSRPPTPQDTLPASLRRSAPEKNGPPRNGVVFVPGVLLFP